MLYTLKRECEIMLVYKGMGYLFDALSSFDFSQTFSKTSNPRRTLHNNAAKPNTLSGSKNAASFSMDVLVTNSFIESVFFEIAGWDKLGSNTYAYPESIKQQDRCDIYILNKSKNILIENAYLESIDMPLALDAPKSLSVSFSASNLVEWAVLKDLGEFMRQGEPVPPTPIQATINSNLLNHITSASFNVKNSISWRQDRGMHDIGNLYSPKRASVVDLAVTGTINLNSSKSLIIPANKPLIVDLVTQHCGVSFRMDSVHLLKRLEPEDVFTEGLDITLLETSRNIIVEFGGITV